MFPPISPFVPPTTSSPFQPVELPPTSTAGSPPTPPNTCGGLVNTLVGGAVGLAVTAALLAMCPSMLLLPQILGMPRRFLHHKMSLENLASLIESNRE